MAESKSSVMTKEKTDLAFPEVATSKGELVVIEVDNKSKQDRTAIEAAKKEVNYQDTASIISFGVKAQRQVTTVSEQMLEGVRNKETGEAGEILNSMVATLRGFDVKDLAGNTRPGIMARIFGFMNPFVKMIQRYEKVQNQIGAMESKLEEHITTLMRDVTALDRLYDSSLEYFHTLAIYIAAGEEMLKDLDEKIMPELKAKAQSSSDVLDSQRLNDMNNVRNALERKVHDLRLTRQVTLQSIPSIRIIQDNDNNLVTKIQSSLVNTVPLWKTQMAQAMTIYHSMEAGKAVKASTDLTNDLLESNARNLKDANKVIRTQVERGVFDITVIEKANQDLIDTINESLAIYEEGKVVRKDAEVRLVKCEQALKERLKDLKVKV